jgi:hypothetical protein
MGKFMSLCHEFLCLYYPDMNTPFQLSQKSIEEFKAIYQEEFKESLSDDEVREIATRLLRFFALLSKQ